MEPLLWHAFLSIFFSRVRKEYGCRRLFIYHNGVTINMTSPKCFSSEQLIYPIGDTANIIRSFADNGYCILGGDILDLKFAHTYDNWFYEPISHLDNSDNIRNSVATALHYIDMYIKLHGTTYHVSLVPTKL